MAVSKISRWTWWHQINSRICMGINYDLYADMSDQNAQPYLRVGKLEIRSLKNNASWITPYLPCTVKIKINNTGTTYTVSSGESTTRYDSGTYDEDVGEMIGYYYTTASSNTNINIPKNGQEFTIHVTVTTKTNQSVSFVEHAAGPISEVLNGPKSIHTGAAAVYTLPRTVDVTGNFSVDGSAKMHFASWGHSHSTYTLYADEYRPVDKALDEVSSVAFLPLRSWATVGEKSTEASISMRVYYDHGQDAEGFVDSYGCMGYNMEVGSISYNVPWIVFNPGTKIVVSSTSKDLVCTAVKEVDESLRPVFDRVVHAGMTNYYERQVERYGGAVQGKSDYEIRVLYEFYTDWEHGDGMKYGSLFYEQKVSDYTSGVPVDKQTAGYSARMQYNVPLEAAVTDAPVILTATDTTGFQTSYTDYVTVLPYHDPLLTTSRARRCSPVTSGAPGEVYYYDGVAYAIDEYGEYALIEWGVDFSSLNDRNSRKLTIRGPSGISGGSYTTVTVDLQDYVCGGYYVVPADPEYSYRVVFTLEDDMCGSNVLCDRKYATGPLVFTYPLNTALAMMDFKRGGTGVALGKVAELDKTFDIHRNWVLKMPYNTMVQNYDQGNAVRLRTWMQNCADRMQAIHDAKPWGIYGERYGIGHTWFEGYTPALIPDGYGEIYDGGNYRCMMVVPNQNRIVGITHVEPFVVNRNYLNLRFDPSYSFRGQGFYNETYKPMIYLCSTRPTSIDQTTGRPNATIVDSQQLTTWYYKVGSNVEGYTYWYCERGYSLNPGSGWTGFDTGILHSFNVASRRGQSLWFVVTCRQGGESQSGYYTYRNAQINLYDAVLSNTIANYEHY